MRALALVGWCVATVGAAVAQPGPAPGPRPPPLPDDIIGEGRPAPGPRTRLTDVTATGDRPPELLRRMVRQRAVALHACYTRELKRNAELTGSLGVALQITRRGAPYAITTPAATDTVGVPRYAQCVRRVVGRTTFPAAKQPSTVTFQLVVTPR